MVAPSISKPDRKVDKFGVSNTVHYTTIASLVPALALCIAHGVITTSRGPVLGLIPAGFGAVLAIYRLRLVRFNKAREQDYQILLPNDTPEGRKCAELPERHFVALADLILLASLSTALAFSFSDGEKCEWTWWYDLEYRRSRQTWQCREVGKPRLEAYATIPLFLIALIHAYLILHYVYSVASKVYTRQRKQRSDALCSRCQLPIREGGRHMQAEEPGAPSMESIA